MKKILVLMMAIIMFLTMFGFANASAESVLSEDDMLTDEVRSELRFYLFANEGEKNADAAFELLLPFVEEENAEAMYYWGWIYGNEFEENDENEQESLYWYELAMDKGFQKAYLGVSLNKFVESEEKAAKIAEDAISLGLFDLSDEDLGPDGFVQIASYYSREENYDKAIEWYLKAAEVGNTVAMAKVGKMYYEGLGVEQDYTQAMEWYLKAADAEIPEVINNIGYMHYNGFGTEQNYAQAMDWYLKAADTGELAAMIHIADMYYEGLGVEQDYQLALEWYLKAADDGYGDPSAMEQLGYMYENGLGTEQDYDEAQSWYFTAYLEGNESAVDGLKSVTEKMLGPDTVVMWDSLLMAG